VHFEGHVTLHGFKEQLFIKPQCGCDAEEEESSLESIEENIDDLFQEPKKGKNVIKNHDKINRNKIRKCPHDRDHNENNSSEIENTKVEQSNILFNTLNVRQKNFVTKCLDDVSDTIKILFGPPGTGKT